MIIAIVSFRLPKPMSLEEATEAFDKTASLYLNKPGLIRKHYFLTQEGDRAGGVYVWRSLFDAQACYSDAWRKMVTDKYGHEPEVLYLQNPVIVDNASGTIEHP